MKKTTPEIERDRCQEAYSALAQDYIKLIEAYGKYFDKLFKINEKEDEIPIKTTK